MSGPDNCVIPCQAPGSPLDAARRPGMAFSLANRAAQTMETVFAKHSNFLDPGISAALTRN